MSTIPFDRFAPESYEDFLCRGKTAQERARIQEELWYEQRRLDEDEVDELAEQFSEGRNFNRKPKTNYHE